MGQSIDCILSKHENSFKTISMDQNGKSEEMVNNKGLEVSKEKQLTENVKEEAHDAMCSKANTFPSFPF